MAKKHVMAARLTRLTPEKHDRKETDAYTASDVSEARATSVISLTKGNKERLTAMAKTHGLSLSAFFRLAADEYIVNHEW